MKQAAGQGGVGEAVDHRHQRAVDLNRVVLLGQRPEVGAEVHGALQGQDFLLGRFDADMAERRLVMRLHAHAG